MAENEVGTLRVLQVVGSLQLGGAEVMAVGLGEVVSGSATVDYLVLTSLEGPLEERVRRHGGQIHRSGTPRETNPLRFVIATRRLLRSRSYDVVHSHINLASGWVLLAARLAGVKVRLAHAHNTNVERHGIVGSIYNRLARRLIAWCSTRYVACGQDAAEAFFGSGWGSRPSNLIRNGVDVDEFLNSRADRDGVRQDLGIPRDALVVGMVARFMPVKNHDFALDVLRQLVGIHSAAHMVLIGDGPLRPEVQRRAEMLGLANRVHFLGVRGDVGRLLGGLDCVIAPSLHEGLPVNLVEAQVAGVPCLISDRVTRECDIGLGLLEWAPLEAGPAHWAALIPTTAARPVPEVERAKARTREAGYDVTAGGSELARLYRQDRDR